MTIFSRMIPAMSSFFKHWKDYSLGMSEYAQFNNVGKNCENTWDSVTNEAIECHQAFDQRQFVETFHEFVDVVHAFLKHLIIKYLPSRIYCSPLFWMLIFPLVFPVAVKLAGRYRQFGCIRNHKNPNNCGHQCSLRKRPIKIYYAVSVRGQDNKLTKTEVSSHIAYLQTFGNVLTHHLASSDPSVIDMQGAQDEDIFAKDMQLVADCDILIADVTSPSLGVGFMIGQALYLNKHVLCLQKQNSGSKLSAMINGHPMISKSIYGGDLRTYQIAVKTFLADLYQRSLLPDIEIKFNSKKIFLIGPPGSGKSTLGKQLAKHFGLIFISTGDICRQVVKNVNHPLSQIVRSYMDVGSLVPADVMKELVVNRLKQTDCQILGYILDGYPSKDDVVVLIEAQIEPDLVFVFKCTDETAITRQCSRGDRVTDEFNAATQRVATFHQNLPNLSSFAKTPVIDVDANQDVDQVIHYVNSCVERSVKIGLINPNIHIF